MCAYLHLLFDRTVVILQHNKEDNELNDNSTTRHATWAVRLY